MSSSDFPEGPLTTKDFLRNKSNLESAPILVSQVPPDADMSISGSPEVILNEQGILSSRQRFRLLRGILWQIPLCFAVVFIVVLLIDSSNPPDAFPIAAIISEAFWIAAIFGLALVFISNVRQGFDLIGSKVQKVVGDYWIDTKGWGKNRRRIYSIGNVVVHWNILMRISNTINRQTESALHEGTRYVVYYLPRSKRMVSYANARTGAIKKESILPEVLLASASVLAVVACFLAATSHV